MSLELRDKRGRIIEQKDYDANEITGVQIGETGHKLWVCVDGIATLRVVSPKIQVDDLRIGYRVYWTTSFTDHFISKKIFDSKIKACQWAEDNLIQLYQVCEIT